MLTRSYTSLIIFPPVVTRVSDDSTNRTTDSVMRASDKRTVSYLFGDGREPLDPLRPHRVGVDPLAAHLD
jgi:hypothetical protein